MMLEHILEQIKNQKFPPVDKWNPQLTGEMDLVIKKNGDWVHQGGIIHRPKLVSLFASILKYEDNQYYLVTSFEKWQIKVESTPLIITVIEQYKQNNLAIITLKDNTGFNFILNHQHAIDFNDSLPTVVVRNNLIARFNTSVYYHLIEMAEVIHNEDGSKSLLLHSDGDVIQLMTFFE